MTSAVRAALAACVGMTALHARAASPELLGTFDTVGGGIPLVRGDGPGCAVVWNAPSQGGVRSTLTTFRGRRRIDQVLPRPCGPHAQWTADGDLLCGRWTLEGSLPAHGSTGKPLVSPWGTVYFDAGAFLAPGEREPFLDLHRGPDTSARAFQVGPDTYAVGLLEPDAASTRHVPYLARTGSSVLERVPVGDLSLTLGWPGHVLAEGDGEALIVDLDTGRSVPVGDGGKMLIATVESAGRVVGLRPTALEPMPPVDVLIGFPGRTWETIYTSPRVSLLAVSGNWLCILEVVDAQAPWSVVELLRLRLPARPSRATPVARRVDPPPGTRTEVDARLTDAREVAVAIGWIPDLVGDAREACASGSEGGCVDLAVAQARGRGMPRDAAAGTTALQGLCGQGALDACQALAELRQHADPEGGTADLQSLCDREHLPSCTALGVLLTTDDRGVAPDRPRAAGLLWDACADGHGPACLEMVRAQMQSPDIRSYDPGLSKRDLLGRAIAWGEPECASGFAEACRVIGEATGWLGWEGTSASDSAAFLERACALGNVEACVERLRVTSNASRTSSTPPSDEVIAGLGARACLLGREDLCRHASRAPAWILGDRGCAGWTDPTSVPVFLALARASTAARPFDRAGVLSVEDAMARGVVGAARWFAGDAEGALRDFEAAFEASASDPPLQLFAAAGAACAAESLGRDATVWRAAVTDGLAGSERDLVPAGPARLRREVWSPAVGETGAP